jgi:flagellar biosynthesis protein FlhB
MEEKPFLPSKKKLEKAQAEGQIPFPAEGVSFVSFLSVMLALVFVWDPLTQAFCQLLAEAFSFQMPHLGPLLKIVILIFLVAALVPIALSFFISQGRLAWHNLMPGRRQNKGRRALGVVKLGVIMIWVIGGLAQLKHEPSLLLLERVFLLLAVLLILEIAEGFVAYRQFLHEAKMTHQEKKEESREERVKKNK